MNNTFFKDLLDATEVLEEKGEVELHISIIASEESFSFAEVMKIRDKFFPNISLDKISLTLKPALDYGDDEFSYEHPITNVFLKIVK